MTLTDRTLIGVLGARGVQGSAIADSLRERGASVRGLGRSLPAGEERDYVSADLAERGQLVKAFAGLGSLCFTMPLIYDADLTRAYAQNVALAAAEVGIERVVLNSNTRIPREKTTVAGFETRRVTEEIFESSGIPVTVVRPTLYLENLLSPPVVAAVENDGVLPYPVPSEMPIAWLSVRDLGATIANVLAVEAFPRDVIEAGGRELTGQELAALMSESLGREIFFASIDPREFEAGLAQALGPAAARGVAGLYHWLNAHPESQLMTSGAAARAKYLAEPTPIADWMDNSWPS